MRRTRALCYQRNTVPVIIVHAHTLINIGHSIPLSPPAVAPP